MRVAILAEVFLPKIDGVVHRTLNLIRHLVESGDDVLVLCPQAPGSKECGAKVVEFPSFPFRLYPEYRIARPNESIIKTIQDFAPDLIHFINPFAFGFQAYDYLHRANVQIPCIFSFHTLYGEFVKQYRVLRPLSMLLWWLMKQYHNQADMNMTVSTGMQKDLIERGFERVQYWPPAVDSDLFNPAAKSTEMRVRLTNGDPEKTLLLTVSRLAPEKNVGFLAQVLDRFPDACLAIVGDGPQRVELEQLFAGKNAHFIGYLKGAELAAAYASADAFVYSSETETMGNVVLEAMACGGAVVAPRAGGIPSLIQPGETGYLYKPGDVDEAVRMTQQALHSDSATLRTAARQWVETRGWAESIRQVRNIYQETIASHGPHTKNALAHFVLMTLVTGFRAIAP